MKFFLNLMRLGCLAFLLAAGGAFWLLHGLLTPASQSGQVQEFTVGEGASGAQVAAELQSQGLIGNALAFRLLLRFHPRPMALRSGVYKLNSGWSAVKIYEHLAKDAPLARRATFPEGLTIVQVADRVAQAELADRDTFLELVRTGGKRFGDYPASLEGYLFPDTYEFPWKCDADLVVRRMLEQFQAVVDPLWSKHRQTSPLRSLHEVVVLASMVEREAQVPQERGVIAGVYINRLRRGMPLQCDATVQYALGQPKAVLTYADLEIDSPYNTYRIAGLPPGPIANPGKGSLAAAMAPTDSDYLYYVRNDLKGDGSHVFTRTYAEHQAACDRYQK